MCLYHLYVSPFLSVRLYVCLCVFWSVCLWQNILSHSEIDGAFHLLGFLNRIILYRSPLLGVNKLVYHSDAVCKELVQCNGITLVMQQQAVTSSSSAVLVATQYLSGQVHQQLIHYYWSDCFN